MTPESAQPSAGETIASPNASETREIALAQLSQKPTRDKCPRPARTPFPSPWDQTAL